MKKISNKKINNKEVKEMRKTLVTLFVVLISVIMVYGYVEATINTACSSCHTMHNKQNGADVDSSGPNTRLLSASCVACHSGTNAQFSGDGKNDFSAPIVLRTGGAPSTPIGGTNTLAGGDFYWVANTGDSYGHNVVGVKAADAVIGVTPPGWDQTATATLTFDSKTLQVTGGAGWTGNQLTCAGTYGCHGTRDVADLASIQGAHHNNLTGTTTKADATNTTNVASSFRFLAGIYGLENSAWNYNEAAGTHNEYYGANDGTDRQYNIGTTVYSDTHTISFLCAECHGLFHGKVADDSSYAYGDPWRRHPTDIVLPSTASAEYDDYNSDNGDNTPGNYSLQAPLARGVVPNSSSATVTLDASATGAIVMCLSCHRAHGSDQPDLLRWDYSLMIAGGSNQTGCFVCHTGKN